MTDTPTKRKPLTGIWCDCLGEIVEYGSCTGCPLWETEDDLKCLTCNGTGTVNELTMPPGFFCVGSMECPHCDGTGET